MSKDLFRKILMNSKIMILPQDICIILTATIHVKEHKVGVFQKDSNDRLEVYLKATKQWLDTTDFRIVLVENSGYEWKELTTYQKKYTDRFQICTFDELYETEAGYLKQDQSKGCSELFSINYAFCKSELAKTSKYVIKVTSRFFIPDLQHFLASIPLEDCHALRQNEGGRCEMVGCRIDRFCDIFYVYALDEHGNRMGHVENVYKFRMEREVKKGNQILVCDLLPIEPTIRGGVNGSYTNI
jgi:hypothetical protein